MHCVDEVSIGCDSAECDSECVECGLEELDPVYDDYDDDVVIDQSMSMRAISEPSKGLCVKGRLKENILFWRNELAAPNAVLSIIESGYVLPLKSMPPPHVLKNQPSAKLHADFVQTSINELITTGCVKQVEEIPYVL